MKKTSFIALFLFILSSNIPAQETPQELYNSAMELKKNNNCIQALILLEKAIALKPDFGEAWLESGWCQNELNNHQEAIAKLEKAKTLLSNNYRINYELGHAYYFLDSVTFSQKYLKESIRLKPDYQLSYVGLGDLYKDKLNNTIEALAWYLKAYGIDSTHKKTNYWIGWCYNDLEKYAKAIPYLEKVVAIDSSNTLAVTELGFALFSIESYDNAIKTFQRVLVFQPKPELAVYYTALCYVRKGDKAEAVNRYNELVILNSKYALNLLSEIKKLK